jgi:hypothetical protein
VVGSGRLWKRVTLRKAAIAGNVEKGASMTMEDK